MISKPFDKALYNFCPDPNNSGPFYYPNPSLRPDNRAISSAILSLSVFRLKMGHIIADSNNVNGRGTVILQKTLFFAGWL